MLQPPAVLASVVLLTFPGPLLSAPRPDAEEREVVAGKQFEAGAFHQFLFGADYRELWTTPVRLPVLDLATFAGGLSPVRRVGHGQTQALALRDASGGAWTFRPIVKDPTGLLPEELRESVAADFVRDQMSSQHPAGHVVVPGLLEAVGILHNSPRLVIMPDDAALGEYRSDFAGVVGDIEEYQGQEGFGGALEVVDGPEMWKRLDASSKTRVDTRTYLTLRLVDHLIGDWDRHLEQWLFANMPGQELWQPYSEDRDQAFVRFEGFSLSFVRPMLPLLVRFRDKYPDMEGLLFDSWDVDRRLLPGLDWAQWEEVTRSVQDRLTDAVIEGAVGRMPAAYVQVEGPRMTEALRARRDKLLDHARHYYEFLSKQVDVRGTFEADYATVVHRDDGRMELRLSSSEGAAPWFDRTFDPGETREVRLYLLRGDDRVTIRGANARIRLRVVGEGGADWIDDSASGHARVYAADPADRVTEGTSTDWDRTEWTPPNVKTPAPWIPPRDWGRRSLFPIVRFAGSTDVGLLARVGWHTTGWGFRKLPWADQQSANVTYSTKLERFRGDYSGRYRPEESSLLFGLDTHYSGIEVIRFYGFGNETPDPGDDNRTQVKQREAVFMPTLRRSLGQSAEVSIGALAEFYRTTRIAGSVLDEVNPYGIEDTGQVGARLGLTLDTTDRVGLPSRGVRAEVAGSVYPEVWDVESTFGEVHGQISTWLSASRAPGAPTLKLRAGGKQVFGTYPFYEAAFIGGSDTVRGLDRQRYAGDAAVWAGAEVSLRLFEISVFAPSQFGILGTADIGRVYYGDESSNEWHHGFGGGLYVATPRGKSAAGVIVARAEGRTRFYLRLGIGF